MKVGRSSPPSKLGADEPHSRGQYWKVRDAPQVLLTLLVALGGAHRFNLHAALNELFGMIQYH